jgi:hypothetical protein
MNTQKLSLKNKEARKKKHELREKRDERVRSLNGK